MIKAVILAAGWGTRMKPLTFTKPKPALSVAGKTVIEHNLDQLSGLIEEVIIVVGYKEEVIRDIVGDEYKGVKVKYVEQEKQLGTGDAARTALPFLDEEFLILNGDDLYKRKDIEKVLENNPSILVKEVNDPTGYGQVSVKNGLVKELIEKPEQPVSNLINIGCYFLNKEFFERELEKSSRGEYEIVDFLKFFIEKDGEIHCIQANHWFPITYPWHLLNANEVLLTEIENNIKGDVEDNCHLKGDVKIEEGVVIKSGTYIEGPVYIKKGSVIGPYSYIRGKTTIGENCRIGKGVEVKNSIIGDGTAISHLSYIGDSIIGDNCNIGGATMVANLRFDKKEVSVRVKGKKINTHREKLGVIMGDNVSVGINSSIMPGVVIGTGAVVGPHLLLKEDVEPKKEE